MVLQLLDEMEADGGLSLSTLGAGPLAAAAISVKHGGLGFSLTDCAVLQRELAMRSPSPSVGETEPRSITQVSVDYSFEWFACSEMVKIGDESIEH